MFLHTATHLDIVRHILSGLYIIVHWVFVSSSLRIWILGLNNINWQYNIPWHKLCHTFHLDKILLDHILSQMFGNTKQKIYITENIKQKMLVTVLCCYNINIILNMLTRVIKNFNTIRLVILWWKWGWLAPEACVGHMILCF